MSPNEVSFLMNVAGTVFGAGVAWGIMRARLNTHEKRIDMTDAHIEDHTRSSVPHLMCPAHQASLDSITTSLAEIKAELRVVSGQIFTISRSNRME